MPSFLITAIIASLPIVASATQEPEWETIIDSRELRELVSGQALDGKYWKFYFRADGVMAYSKNDYPSVRQWSITKDATLCYSVYSLPDRVINCHTVQRTNTLPTQYRFTSESEEFLIEFSTPEKLLLDAVTERAGPE